MAGEHRQAAEEEPGDGQVVGQGGAGSGGGAGLFLLSCPVQIHPDCPPSAGAAHLRFDEIRTIAPAAFVGSQRLLWHVESDPPALCVQRGRSRVGSRNPTRVVEPLLWPNTAIQGLRIHRAGIYLGKGQLVSSKSPVPGPAILLWEEGSL